MKVVAAVSRVALSVTAFGEVLTFFQERLHSRGDGWTDGPERPRSSEAQHGSEAAPPPCPPHDGPPGNGHLRTSREPLEAHHTEVERLQEAELSHDAGA